VIRFLMSLVFIGLFLYFNVTEPFRFVFTFFALYLFYTSFEIYENNRKLRRDLK
jgi:hypothetical protein